MACSEAAWERLRTLDKVWSEAAEELCWEDNIEMDVIEIECDACIQLAQGRTL